MGKKQTFLSRLKNKFFSKHGPALNRMLAEKMDGMHIRYAVERIDGVETILGKEGHINRTGVQGENISIVCGVETLFCAEISKMELSELLSLDGAVLSGYDLHSGRYRTVIAYYQYYR